MYFQFFDLFIFREIILYIYILYLYVRQENLSIMISANAYSSTDERSLPADIRAACCGCVPVVGRGGARSRSRPTRSGCNDHQPQIGVTRGRCCPTYTG